MFLTSTIASGQQEHVTQRVSRSRPGTCLYMDVSVSTDTKDEVHMKYSTDQGLTQQAAEHTGH